MSLHESPQGAPAPAPLAAAPMISVRGLTKRYDTFVALSDLNFTVARGEVVGFLGPNGAGKTTTMKILTATMPPSEGEVRVDGLDVTRDSLAVRARIGYLPESTPLYGDMLVYDYLQHAGTLRGVAKAKVALRIREVARMCGLADRLGQEIQTLSKGYKQRVGLAQALIHDPDILILDEPTSGLDPNQIVEIRHLIKALGTERTILLSTHNLPEVMATCNRVLIIHKGKIVADGTAEALEQREHATQHLRLVLSRQDLTPEGVMAELIAVGAGTVSCKEARPDSLHFELQSGADVDLRPVIFALAVARGWSLLELQREHMDLEALFRKLTQET